MTSRDWPSATSDGLRGDALLRRHWYAVCRSADLRGDRPLAVRLFGRPLVVFRDAQRRAAVLEDRCAHRHAPLSAGRVCAGRLQCPYHGWEYGAGGEVLRVPALGDDAAATANLRTAALPTCEQDGLVWAWPGDGQAQGPPRRIAGFDTPGWTRFIMKTRFRGSVEACLENFLDCPHATYLHRYWFRAPTARRVRATVHALPDGAAAEFLEEPRERSLVWWLLAPRRGTMRHTDRFIAPRTSSVTYEFEKGASYSITSSCTGLAPNRTQVYTVITFRYGWIGPLLRLAFEPLAKRIIRQDVDMLAEQQRNIERFGGPRFASTRADLLGRHIVAWRRALVRGEPMPQAGERSDVDIRL